MDENPLKRCLKGVIRCEWWISELRRSVGYMSQCRRGELVTPQTFVEIEGKSFSLFFTLLLSGFEHYAPKDGLQRMCLHG